MINTELFKEVSPLSSKDCFILIERQKTNFNFPIHIHPECELNFIENAKGAQRIVGDSIEKTMEGIGQLARDGMKECDDEIIRLMIQSIS